MPRLSTVLAVLLVTRPVLALANMELSRPHPRQSPAEALEHLAKVCRQQGIDDWDVYGDLDRPDSFLRRFEAQVAEEFGLQDAVFMPSGVMAQSIALLIHAGRHGGRHFAAHHSSHLLLHEQSAYRALLGMDVVEINTTPSAQGIHVPPLTAADVERALHGVDDVSTLLVELPHRELGGKLTPYEDLLSMRDYCRSKGMAMHCDGARIFEATAGYHKSLPELAAPFDSLYLSFYKGLGGLSAAMLLGSTDFCAEARVWLRRFGGNLYTLLPYIVSAADAHQRRWVAPSLTFDDKRDRLQAMVEQLSQQPLVARVVAWDPPKPVVNLVHGYLVATPVHVLAARDRVEAACGIRVLERVRAVDESEVAYAAGYRSRLEWTMGEANAAIEPHVFVEGWTRLAEELLQNVEE